MFFPCSLQVSIPMKFAGEGHVELRPPKDLEDLKAYTSLSLSLQRPEGRGDGRRRRRQASDRGDMFVMYLGNRDVSDSKCMSVLRGKQIYFVITDKMLTNCVLQTKNYIGMYLKNNVLHGVYKLNGKEITMKTGYITKSPSEPAKFDKVDLNR